MVSILNRPTIMSLPEFFEFERIGINNIESFTTRVMKNKKFKKFAITLLACSLYFQDAFAKGKGIDSLGMTLLGLIRHWAYWILIIMCIVEIIRAGIGGNSKTIFPILMKYLLIFSSMYLVPTLFDAIKNSF